MGGATSYGGEERESPTTRYGGREGARTEKPRGGERRREQAEGVRGRERVGCGGGERW